MAVLLVNMGDDRGIYGGNLNATPGFTSHYSFNASRCSSIYSESANTVTPLSLSTKFIISYV